MFIRSALIATAAALIAAPALAAPKRPITVPQSALKDPAGKLCMPKSVLGRGAAKDLPATLCHTTDEWATQGVTVVVK